MDTLPSTMMYTPLELHNHLKASLPDPFNCLDVDVLFEKDGRVW
jgi:hypothetical protein